MMEGVAGTAHPAPPAPTIDTVLRDGVRDAHHLLRALEIEVAAFAAELAADPLDAALHAQADRCRAELTQLIDRITLDPPIVLTEPSDAAVAAIAARAAPRRTRRRRAGKGPVGPRPDSSAYHSIPLVSIGGLVRR